MSARIQADRQGMIPSELKVVDLIVTEPSTVLTSSVSEVAELAGTSESTVIRACQRIGYRGFHDVKLALARDLATQQHDSGDLQRSGELGPSTPCAEIPALLLRESANALHDVLNTLDVTSFEAAVEVVADARRLLVLGNGTSSAPARDAAYRFSTLGLVVQAPGDAFGQDLAAHTHDERDAVIVISHTGATRETLTPVETAAKQGVPIIAVTSYTRSPLSSLATHLLVAGGPELGFRQEAMTSRLAHLVVLDAIFVGVALARPKRSREHLELMSQVTAAHSY